MGATGAHIRLRSLHELETMQNDEVMLVIFTYVDIA